MQVGQGSPSFRVVTASEEWAYKVVVPVFNIALKLGGAAPDARARVRQYESGDTTMYEISAMGRFSVLYIVMG